MCFMPPAAEYQKMGKVVMDGEFGPPVVTG